MCQMDGSSEIEVLLYEADALSNEEAIKLFSQYAFKQDMPEIDHVNLSDHKVKYAYGHPLALKVLGSSLYGKTIDELDKLKRRFFLTLLVFFK